MSPRRRRPRGRKIYTLAYLMEKQPKSLKKVENYDLLISTLHNSPELGRVKFNRRCYSLLHNAVIKSEHLNDFYRTYRLPIHPFFPLFLIVKRSYLDKRERIKSQREDYIRNEWDRLPEKVKFYLFQIRELEKGYNRGNKPMGQAPLFAVSLYPKTKKQADTYRHSSGMEWISRFESHNKALADKYGENRMQPADRLLAAFVLDCLPDDPLGRPSSPIVKQNYRRLSLIHHPDQGGDAAMFRKLQWAREILAGPAK